MKSKCWICGKRYRPIGEEVMSGCTACLVKVAVGEIQIGPRK